MTVTCGKHEIEVHPVGQRWHGVCPRHRSEYETFAIDRRGVFVCFVCGWNGFASVGVTP
jgi:hypothetical protein